MTRWDRGAIGFLVLWIAGLLVSLGFVGVVIWAIVRLVLHFTAGG